LQPRKQQVMYSFPHLANVSLQLAAAAAQRCYSA